MRRLNPISHDFSVEHHFFRFTDAELQKRMREEFDDETLLVKRVAITLGATKYTQRSRKFRHIAIVKPISDESQKVIATIPIRKWKHKSIPIRRTGGNILIYENKYPEHVNVTKKLLSALQKAHIEEE